MGRWVPLHFGERGKRKEKLESFNFIPICNYVCSRAFKWWYLYVMAWITNTSGMMTIIAKHWLRRITEPTQCPFLSRPMIAMRSVWCSFLNIPNVYMQSCWTLVLRPSHPILSECHWNIEDESNGEGFTPGGQTEPTCAAHLWISSHQLYLLPLRIFPPKSAISERLGLVSHILGKKCPEKTFNFRHLFFKYKHRYRKSMCFAKTKTKTEKRCRQI